MAWGSDGVGSCRKTCSRAASSLIPGSGMASTKRYGGLTGGILPEQRLASGADHLARAVRLFHDAASQGDGRGRARSLSVVGGRDAA